MFAVTVSEVALAHTVITDGLSFHATRCEMVMTPWLYNASFAESFFFLGGGGSSGGHEDVAHLNR